MARGIKKEEKKEKNYKEFNITGANQNDFKGRVYLDFIPLVYDLTIGSKYIFLFDDAGNIMESIDRNQVESVTIHVL